MNRSGLFFILLFSVTLNLLGERAEARRSGYNYVSIGTQVHSYVDILRPDTLEPKRLSEDFSLNIDFRIFRVFSLMLIGGQSFDTERRFFGLGFRADLPGIFFVNGTINDLIHRKRRRGTATYFSYQSLVVNFQDGSSNVTGERFALGMDFDLDDDFYLNVEPAIYSQDGNRYFSGALGIGIEF